MRFKIRSQANLFKFLFDWKEAIESKTQSVQKNLRKRRILLTPENCNTFKMTLERLFKKEKIPIHSIHSHKLTHLIQSALADAKEQNLRSLKQIAFQLMLGLTRNAKRQGECGKSQTRIT